MQRATRGELPAEYRSSRLHLFKLHTGVVMLRGVKIMLRGIQ
jgi:hypothetical protein